MGSSTVSWRPDAGRENLARRSRSRADVLWLTGLSRALGRPATLDDVPEAEPDRIARMGFDWVWVLSVWRTGSATSDRTGSGSHLRSARRVMRSS